MEIKPRFVLDYSTPIHGFSFFTRSKTLILIYSVIISVTLLIAWVADGLSDFTTRTSGEATKTKGVS